MTDNNQSVELSHVSIEVSKVNLIEESHIPSDIEIPEEKKEEKKEDLENNIDDKLIIKMHLYEYFAWIFGITALLIAVSPFVIYSSFLNPSCPDPNYPDFRYEDSQHSGQSGYYGSGSYVCHGDSGSVPISYEKTNLAYPSLAVLCVMVFIEIISCVIPNYIRPKNRCNGITSIYLGIIAFAIFLNGFFIWDSFRKESCPDPNYTNLHYDGGDHFTDSCYSSTGYIKPLIVQSSKIYLSLIIDGCFVGLALIPIIFSIIVDCIRYFK